MSRHLLVALALGLSVAQATPPDVDTAPDGIAPKRSELVPWVAPPPVPDAPNPSALAGDPAALIRYVESRPERLNVDSMDPALALTMAQVLLRGNRTFLAEKLLHDASKRWPESVDLGRAWARVLISIGRPGPAAEALTRLKATASLDATLRYLLARALLATEPRTPELEAEAIEELRAVLEINPQFSDADGVTAKDLRLVIQRIRSGRRATGPAAP